MEKCAKFILFQFLLLTCRFFIPAAVGQSFPDETPNFSGPTYVQTMTDSVWTAGTGEPSIETIAPTGAVSDAVPSLPIEYLPIAFSATITPTHPTGCSTQGSVGIDLTGDVDGNTTDVEYAIVVGNTFSGSLAFSTITADPFIVGSGTGTTAVGTYTIRVRLSANPIVFQDFTYTLTTPVTAGPATWTGATNTDWHNPCNWDVNAVPSATSDVTIPDVANDPVILAGTTAVAKSVAIAASGALTLNAAGSLTIEGSPSAGMLNQGTVTNNGGSLRIGPTSSPGSSGLVNQGTFNNNANGEVAIDRSTGIGLWNKAGAATLFANAGKITVGGIANVGASGLYNEAVFQNNGGEIGVDRISGAAVYNLAGSSFVNTGKIAIGKIQISSGTAIYNFADFQNKSAGEISVDRANSGVFNNPGASFINEGKIAIGQTTALTGPGIYNFGSLAMPAYFQNKAGGEVTADRVNAGIHNESNSTFDNEGLIKIGATATLGGSNPGLYNRGLFNNTATAEILIDDVGASQPGLHNEAGTFTNGGKITSGITATIGGSHPNLHNNATFVNQATGEIRIDYCTKAGLQNSFNGSFTNEGLVDIGKNVNGGEQGFYNDGTVDNKSTGVINIDRVATTGFSSNGLYNGFNKTFTNAGKITIGLAASAGKNGLYNYGDFNNNGGEIDINRITGTGDRQGLRHENGTFTNTGKIAIGRIGAVSNWGLWNQSTFNNDAGGEITIIRTAIAGLRNNNNVFTNKGKIVIGTGAEAGNWGIWNEAAFNNDAGGEIAIDSALVSGLRHQSNTFNNAGTIVLGAATAVGEWGLWNESAFNNSAGGEIRINRTTNTGLLNFSNTFANNGEINIGDLAAVGDQAIYNQATLDNGACAVLNIHAPLHNVATLSNLGLFYVNTLAAHTNTGFVNNGVIAYPQGNPIPAVTNNDLIVQTIDSECGVLMPALQIGGANSFTVGATWFKNQNLTDPAGTYNQAANAFTPTNVSESAQTLYFSVTDNANGCPRTVPITLTTPVTAGPATWTGATNTDWHNPCNWDANAVPSATSDVTIPNVANDPVILAGATAVAKSVAIGLSGALTLNAGASLTIEGSATGGMLNEGTVTNNGGSLRIGPTSSPGSSGLVNQGAFNNNANGEVAIDRSSSIGLWNKAGATTLFANAGKITIGGIAGAGSSGIYNEAVFQNNGGEIHLDRSNGASIYNLAGSSFVNTGKIAIGQVELASGAAIYNFADFQNKSTGEIVVDRANSGVFNKPGASFINEGKIAMGQTAALTGPGVYNFGSAGMLAHFQNKAGGEITADRVSVGVHNESNSTFDNEGLIKIGTTAALGGSNPGLYNKGLFNNTATAEIRVDNVGPSQPGLHHETGTFTNGGKITIGITTAIGGTHPNFHNNGTFVNQATGEIRIDYCSEAGFQNSFNGSFTNEGLLDIGKNVNGGEQGFFNDGTVDNKTTGVINIDHVTTTGFSSNGIYNGFNKTFANAGKITIGSAVSAGKNGVYNYGNFNNAGGEIAIDHITGTGDRQGLRHNNGTFTNTGKIAIGRIGAVSDWGLWNQAAFNNDANGEISIDRSAIAGLRNESSTFTNAGKIVIGSKASIGNWGLWNQAAFSNSAGGEINIDNALVTGLRHQSNTFNNTGTIALGTATAVGDWGLWNQSAFNNNAGGLIRINRTTSTGLLNFSNTFANNGELTIGDLAAVGDQAIYNEATLNNSACAVLNIHAPLHNVATLSNLGLFYVNTLAVHTNTGFVNNGVIAYPQGNPIPAVTNNDLIVQPIGSECGVLMPALQIGGANSFTAAAIWFKNQNLTDQAGTYNQAANAFTPTNVSEGAHTLYFSVDDNANNCPRTVPIKVTYDDTMAPSISCPDNIVRNTDPNLCTTVVTYAVTASDNCAYTLTLTQGFASGAAFPKGLTNVAWKVTDAGGHATSCAFTVTVTDNQAPTITCPSPMLRNTDANQCTAITTYAPTASDNCPGVTTSLVSGPASGAAFPKGMTTVELKATDAAGLMSNCMFTVTVTDNQAPVFTYCPGPIVRYVDVGTCVTTLAFTGPTYSDNCPGATLTKLSGPSNGDVLTKGTYQTIWKLEQAGGALMAQCTLNITILDNQAPAIACPPTQTKHTDPGQCTALVTYNNPTAADNCNVPAPTTMHVSGGTGTAQGASTSSATFAKGITTVQWKAVDGVGLTKTCTFRVIVNDLEAPVLTCSLPAPVNAAPGTCGAAFTYANPTFAENCAPTSGTSVRVSGPASGSTFPVGKTYVWFQATDAAGNTKRCSITVTVLDDQPPVASCPPPVAVAGSGNPCTATVFYANATASDNCAGTLTPFLLSGLASGSSFPAGVTTNTWRAIAPNGQSADCSFAVTVTCGALRSGAENRDATAEGATNHPSPSHLPTFSPSHLLTFSLSPNPAAQEAWLDLSAGEGQPCAVYLLDVRGALVQQHPVAQTTAAGLFRLDLEGLPTGLYFVQVQVAGQRAEMLKLVVERR